MTNISSKVAHDPLRVSPPQLNEPEEFDPMELYKLVKNRFDWKLWQFAIAFGCETTTIYAWSSGRSLPSRQARIIAALLKKLWGFN